MLAPYEPWEKYKTRLRPLGEAQNWRCCYCGIRCHEANTIGDGWNTPTCEHVIPIGWGGLRIWENEVMACRLCNNGRGRMRPAKYLALVQELGRWKAFKVVIKERKKRKHNGNGQSAGDEK